MNKVKDFAQVYRGYMAGQSKLASSRPAHPNDDQRLSPHGGLFWRFIDPL